MQTVSANVQRFRLFLLVGLALIAYRSLILPRAELEQGVAEWLFLPSSLTDSAILLLAGWLLIRRRKHFAALDPSGGPAGLTVLLLTAGCSLLAWSNYVAAPDLLPLSLTLNGLGLAHLYAGRAGLRAVALPAGLVLFAMPLPPPLLNEMLFRMQTGTANLVGWLFAILDVPVFVSGIELFRPNGHFAVIEGCSGLRSIEILTVLALLIVGLSERSSWQAASIVLAAPVLAALLNVVRVFSIVIRPDSGWAEEHSWQGIAILMAGTGLLYLLELALPRPEGTPPAPEARTTRGDDNRSTIAGAVLVACAVLSLALPQHTPSAEPLPSPALAIPERLPGWESSSLQSDPLFLERVRFYYNTHRRYESAVEEEPPVDLFVGVDSHSRRDRSAWSPKTTYPGGDYDLVSGGASALEEGGAEVSWYHFRRAHRHYLVRHWREGSSGLGEEILRSALALDSSPWRRPRPLLVVRMTTDLEAADERGEAAEARLSRFRLALDDAFVALRAP